jgi:hypothetical protein
VKQFDSELYERDDSAKFFVIDWLRTLNIEAWVNPDQYGIDLLGTSELGDFEIEVEVKHNWSGPRFPFKTIHYSARKTKFLKEGVNLRFVTLNKEWTHAAVVRGEQLLSAKVIEKDTIYTSAESFLEIPAKEIQFYATNHEDW